MPPPCSDPGRQFELAAHHIHSIRRQPGFGDSRIIVYVERNLGFEAEHHQRALGDMPGVEFYVVSRCKQSLTR